MPRSRYFWDVTQPEVVEQFKRHPLVIMPAGSVEQHGPHLPTGTDTVIAEMQDWAARPLDGVYVAVFIDAIMVKVRGLAHSA